MLTRFAAIFLIEAEEGIRDSSATGVQTCALPIWRARRDPAQDLGGHAELADIVQRRRLHHHVADRLLGEIGRASCRDREEGSVVVQFIPESVYSAQTSCYQQAAPQLSKAINQ